MSGYPQKIFLIGFMGVGKSHWGLRLAQQLQYSFFDLDEEISRSQNGQSISDIFEQDGETYFRKLESETLRKIATTDRPFVMACGGGTPCFSNNMEIMNAAGLTIWIQADTSELTPRLWKEREKRPLLKDLDADQLVKFIEQKLTERTSYYQQAKRTVLESELSTETLLKQLLYE